MTMAWEYFCLPVAQWHNNLRRKKKENVSIERFEFTGDGFQMIDGLFALVQRRSLHVLFHVQTVTSSRGRGSGSSSSRRRDGRTSSCRRRHHSTTTAAAGGRSKVQPPAAHQLRRLLLVTARTPVASPRSQVRGRFHLVDSPPAPMSARARNEHIQTTTTTTNKMIIIRRDSTERSTRQWRWISVLMRNNDLYSLRRRSVSLVEATRLSSWWCNSFFAMSLARLADSLTS